MNTCCSSKAYTETCRIMKPAVLRGRTLSCHLIILYLNQKTQRSHLRPSKLSEETDVIDQSTSETTIGSKGKKAAVQKLALSIANTFLTISWHQWFTGTKHGTFLQQLFRCTRRIFMPALSGERLHAHAFTQYSSSIFHRRV